MSFTFPLALVIIPIAALAILATLRTTSNRSPRPLTLALLRLLTITAVALALAHPFSHREDSAQSLVALLDVSSSVSEGQGNALLERARELGKQLGVPVRVFPFSRTLAQASVTAPSDFPALRRSSERLDTGATDISVALKGLSGSSPSAALLLSDGYETAGSVAGALPSLVATRVFPLTAPGESAQSALSISQLYVPLTVKAKKSAEIRATMTNGSQTAQQAELVIKHGQTPVLTKTVRVAPGEDLLITAQSDPNLEGLNTVSATLTWRDRDGEHSVTKTGWLSSEKRNKVLLLSGTADDDRFLSQILKNQAYELDTRSAQGGAPLVDSPSPYRTVILNNVPAESMPAAFMSALPAYVRGGGSLIMIGGNRSFGLGRYIGSPVEEILPVTLVPPHTEKKRLNVAVQLVIDKSRSMAEDSRLEFAKAAAREVVATLKDDDYIGVIGFEEVAFIALPISRVGDVRSTASDRISRLFPANRTNLYPALEEGRRGLSRVNAGRKHLIVLTDGQIPDQGPIYFGLIKQLRLLGITVSTVLVGADAPDAFLVEIANQGGGSFYQTNDPRNLPRIFLSDIKVATGEQTLKEDPELLVSVGPDGVTSTSIRSFPPLRGFVETLPRSGAATELVVSEADKRYPLLASWRVGSGRSIAFTSDANGRWSAPWIRWAGIEEFWSDIVEAAQTKPLEKPSSTQFDLRTWVEGGDVVIDLSLFDESQGGAVVGSLTTPSGETRTVSFAPKQRGHYQARLPGATAGTYRAVISLGDQKLPEVAWTLSGELFGEKQHRAPNVSLLERIASATGGKLNPSAEELKPLMTEVLDKRDLTHYFLIAALALLFLEVLAREGLRRLPSRR